MVQTAAAKFTRCEITEETVNKLNISLSKCENMDERMLRCPLCKFPIIGILSDATGHLRFKCPKCKSSVVVNLSYFRRIKRNLMEYSAKIYSIYLRYISPDDIHVYSIDEWHCPTKVRRC